MLCVDRYSRPYSENLEKELSLYSTADASLICNCATDATRTKCEESINACKKGSVAEVKAILTEGVDPRSLGVIHFATTRGERLLCKYFWMPMCLLISVMLLDRLHFIVYHAIDTMLLSSSFLKMVPTSIPKMITAKQHYMEQQAMDTRPLSRHC
jgi:hypothetical protein